MGLEARGLYQLLKIDFKFRVIDYESKTSTFKLTFSHLSIFHLSVKNVVSF